jgi:cell wall-associated NlpC family hydrolase
MAAGAHCTASGARRCALLAPYAICLCMLLTSCSSTPEKPAASAQTSRPSHFRLEDQQTANEIVMQAMALLDTGYQFGGRNPEAGLDCSGMVSLVVEKVTGRRLPHNAAQIASQTRDIRRDELKPADLVFFNTSGKPYSHMGIYLGEGRFLHAPASHGKVRVDKMEMAYYAKRFTGARTLFD